MGEAIVTPIDSQTIGNVLRYILTTKEPYKIYNNTYNSTTNYDILSVEKYIKEVFEKHLGTKVTLDFANFDSVLQPGDIVKANHRIYVITQTAGVELPITWPEKAKDDMEFFTGHTIKTYQVTRPNLISNDITNKIDVIAKDILSNETESNKLLNAKNEVFLEADKDTIYEQLGDGVLQIGDLIFVVDPTQISFNTQNGYQYFPTIRTQGNPKVPTINQVKNLSINLIFPNEDSINYQLLNLYAMFKRTPFVNIRNKDISAFFKDICYGEWLSVALESIQIQSVEGFPNTLQASITILPFDQKMISNGFQGLLSFEDVERQQAVLYNDKVLDSLIRKSEAKLNEQNITSDRFIDILSKDIKKTPDFRNSLPFRAFYQGLIAERDCVVNNFGQPVPTNLASNFKVDRFRPSDPDNSLHEYRASSNLGPVGLSYAYIPEDFRSISKKASDQRLDVQNDTLRQLNNIYDLIKTPEDIARQMTTIFTTKDDLFKITSAQFDRVTNGMLPTILARHGFTINGQEATAIKHLGDLIFNGINMKLGTKQTWEVAKDLDDIINNRISPDTLDVVGYLNGSTFYDTKTHGVGTFQHGIKTIWDALEKGTDSAKFDKKAAFAAVLVDLRQTIQKELGLITTSEMISVNPQADGEIFKVDKLPIAKATLNIDNVNDVITGWSLVFANKFVPINIQAFKYPYYQHIGSDDPSISLVITSTTNKPIDFKSELSLLSERIYETVKTVTFNTPELITYLDCRLTVDVPVNHVFSVFGIKKVVFDTSSTVNINGQPGCWKTNVSLTQSNFTIAQYHNVSQVPSNQAAIQQIARLMAGIEISGEGSNATFNVMNYSDRDGRPLTLDEIMRIRFLEWSMKNKDQKYNIISHIHNVLDNNVRVVGEDVAETYLKELRSLSGTRGVNVVATTALRNLTDKSPEYRKILLFLNSQLDSLFKEKAEVLKGVIFPEKSFISDFWSQFKLNMGGTTAVITGVGLLIGFFMIPVVAGPALVAFATTAALVGTSTGGAITILQAAKSAVGAVQNKAKKDLVKSFDNIFLTMEESFTTAIAIDFATKVLRDPVVYKKLITPQTIGANEFNNIERLKNTARVQCYGDFDLPNFEDMIIGPDFYLYNNIVSNAEMRTHVNEASKRYAKVGKLTSMMTLTEATEVLEKFDNIISRVDGIDPQIEKGVKETLLENITGSNISTPDIKSLISSLKNANDVLSLCTLNIDEAEMTDAASEKILRDFRETFAKELKEKPEEYEAVYKTLAAKVTRSKNGITVGNLDFKKLNLIHSARMKTMMEIFDVYSVLNTYMIENKNALIRNLNQTTIKSDNKSYDYLSKNNSDYSSANELYDVVKLVLSNPKQFTTKYIESLGNDDKTKLKKIFKEGLATSSPTDNYLTLPGIQNVQNFLYNKIGYYIRLNTFIEEYNSKGGPNAVAKIDLSTLPELQFLDFWGFRAVEENQRKLQILKQLTEDTNYKKDTTIKMFPTFKLFFVEEDKNFITHNFDDYYTHNAIQSIEIITNKNSPSTTAVVRLSNVTNSLTDKMSLQRETEDLFGYSLKGVKSPNLFFGTLDIKPGTQIIIKMGYAPYDNLLTTVFQGRIIEMNNGPNVEMICQSFGAQLNHHIVQHKFGLFSTEREHGDVASSVLDMIPGLEKLGKPTLLGLSEMGDFTGRNIKNMTGKLGDRVLMSNLLGSLSSMTFGQDNPRDENIYLEYSAVTNIKHKPTFDWVIYDQSVWDSLRELTLYHRNKIVTLRPYNSNSVSSNNELRETLVIGDKNGYYKNTDAFALSTLNFQNVDELAAKWNDMHTKIFNKIRLYDVKQVDNKITTSVGAYGAVYNNTIEVYLTVDGKQIYTFLENRLNALVLIAHLLKKHENTSANANWLVEAISKLGDNRFIPDSFKELITDLTSFSKMGFQSEDSLQDLNLGDGSPYAQKFSTFVRIINGLRIHLTPGNRELNPEEYYNVKDNLNNLDEKYLNDPQYTKIQKHHLVSDVSDIISNNISLNSNFANVVNVYYTGEPKIKTASIDRLDDDYIKDHLRLWTVKAFGDTRDEFSRPKNSYQKNIDTNWFDMARASESFYQTYNRIKVTPGLLSELTNKNMNETNAPRWDLFPSYVVVGVSLLQREVEKMYQGTLELVGNPNIQPFDIIHLQDYTNDMHGVIEVEEVIHTFTPDGGFRTVITPNLITFDRDPIQMQDVQVINQVYDFANRQRVVETVFGSVVGATVATAGLAASLYAGPVGIAAGIGLGLTGGDILWNSSVGTYNRYHKFLYEQMGNILGRDCINFTSLIYHGLPYMAGFDGVDYTNLKTLMNHNVAEIKNPITRYLAFGDTFKANITTGWDPENYTSAKKIFGGL